MSCIEYRESAIKYRKKRKKTWQDLSITLILSDPWSNIKKYIALKDSIVFQTDCP